MPPAYNHPARAAERIATLDLVSNGRVDFGTGESASRAELEGFGITPAKRRAMWQEAVEQVANMLVMDPYPGYSGEYFSMPCRNVVPKPVQKPHPPMWVACSNRDTIRLAARLGLGVLTFAFIDASEAKKWVDDYYTILKTECTPIGHTINPNVAMVTSFSCHEDEVEARARGLDGFRFFQFALAYHYGFGKHKPGRGNIWERYTALRDTLPPEGGQRGIGTPQQLRAHLRDFADAGVDQVIFIQQGGKNRHEHICESLDLFAADVMPEFKEHEDERERRKLDALAPHLEAAMQRKSYMPALADEEIPEVEAYGIAVAETDEATLDEGTRRRREHIRRIAEAANRP
jgi:alkanesulfonate monooxygenase SsuD/methylene tetrahydromethanopterin reductase-like flavin-dependent oxidoreductase (luciferase family)